MMMMIGDVYAQ